jgi:hypothetical protein
MACAALLASVGCGSVRGTDRPLLEDGADTKARSLAETTPAK